METNNNNSTFSLYEEEKLTIIMPMKMCCIVGCPAITDSLIAFPPKHTKEYTFWLRACKESQTNIIFKQNPMICVLHFRNNMDKMPIRYVTKGSIQILNDDLARINHCVAEWLLFIRDRMPDKVITDKDVYAKAKEIGRVYQVHHFKFDIDFGWMHIFEKYLHSKGIESWKPNSKNFQILNDYEKIQSKESITNGAVVEQSIKTYEEALKRVQILYSYCKRTQNKSALDVIQRLNEVLQEKV